MSSFPPFPAPPATRGGGAGPAGAAPQDSSQPSPPAKADRAASEQRGSIETWENEGGAECEAHRQETAPCGGGGRPNQRQSSGPQSEPAGSRRLNRRLA